ncbi:WYL domain-containing protein [Synechococcus sp. PCC 7502]|uniref:WYL domain-containing protein n=1 Tax=Synechococcus sp. PCC 7502 TaxID=1173263 RepID=UPI001FF06446|nr:WYL domain-containing protein [Synechococcus sp. PCC 7502]
MQSVRTNKMGRRGQSITLSISDHDKAQLEELALELGMMWGDRPNITKLVEEIARKKLIVAPKQEWGLEQTQALERGRSALIDIGKITEALAIAQLLIEHGTLTIPLKNELERFIIKPTQTWRLEVEKYIRRGQPFRLTYQDAAEQIHHFHIQFAEIGIHEDRQYLDCWCKETIGNLDIPELCHNWSLRLDRIAEASTTPISEPWRSGLDNINIEMHLFHRLAFAYKTKINLDIENEWLVDIPQTKRIVRKITNTFWFIREILRYGQDCKVLSPDNVQNLIKMEIEKMRTLY